MLSSDDLTHFLLAEKDNSGTKFCFILGSGCSVENGIPTGAQLAEKWFGELAALYSEEQISKWQKEEQVDAANPGLSYSKIFKFRFGKHPAQGYDSINAEVEKGRLGIGHIVLSQLMLKTESNVVVTTNFDTLVEEAVYNFSGVRPIICGHESVAGYARPNARHPLIVKIHRDRFMDPFNLDDEIAVLSPGWVRALNNIFENYIPIVMGYGGNDGSLMGYLRNAQPCRRMFWCVVSGRPLRRDIMDVIDHHNGDVVKIEGFNRFMLRLLPVYNIKGIDKVVTERAKKLSKKFVDSLLDLTTQVVQNGSAAEKTQLAALNGDIQETDWWHWEMLAERAGSERERMEIYESGLKKIPGSSPLHYNYGHMLMDYHQEKAIEHFEKAIEYDAENTAAWYNLALIYRQKDEFRKAVSYYRKVVELSSTHASAWSNMGSCLHSLGDYEEAALAYKRAIAARPEKASTWNNLGFTYKACDRLAEAVSAFRQSSALDPALPQPYFNIANIHYGLGEYSAAIENYNKVVSLQPDFADAYKNLFLCFDSLGEKENAREALRKGLLIDPNDREFKDLYDQL